MKTHILASVLLCAFFLSNAQQYEYVPFVNEEVVWSYCDVIKLGDYDYNLHYSQYKFSGDTAINDITYKKLYKNDCPSDGLHYIASMREENKKGAYFITPDLLRVESELSDPNCTFELLDLNGKLLVQKNIDRNNNTINVSQFPNGLYVLRLSRNG